MSKKKRLQKSIANSLLGKNSEPRWESDEANDQELTKLLNWYAYNKSSDDAQKYLLDYLKKNSYTKEQIAIIDGRFSQFSRSIAFVSRAAVISEKFPESLTDRIDTEIDRVLALEDFVTVESESPAVSKEETQETIQDRLKNQCRKYLAEIDGLVDVFVESGCKEFPDFYEFLKDNSVKSVHIKNIIAAYDKTKDELTQAYDKTDEQLVEGYSNFTRKQLKNFIEFFNKLEQDCSRWLDVAKQISSNNRKPRAKKVKAPHEQVKKLKYCKEFEDLKSINPEKIIGATALWVYNSKTRKLGQYVASNDRGLLVKGSTIINFEAKNSSCKTIRNRKQLDEFFSISGKVANRKFLEKIKAKEKLLTGRINSDTIIFKTF